MNFNEQQLEAINCNDERILVLAGAGSGKSAVLLARIARLVKEGADPRSILALTFTNAASFDMKTRFKRMMTCNPYPEFKTFHAFCYKLIVTDYNVRNTIGYERVPQIANEAKIKELSTEAKMQCGIHLSQDDISYPENLSLKEKKELEIYNKALNRLLKKENLITFDMLCGEVCDLFVKDDPSILSYKKRYKYILVDEFQDTSPKQYRFIGSFPNGTHWFVVGDVLQGIYGFRDADSRLIKMLAKNDEWTKIRLFENYRSTNQIVAYANARSKYVNEEYRITMHGQRDGAEVEEIYGSECTRFDPVDTRHLNMLTEMVQNSTMKCAVLCRTNKEVNYICDKFKEENINYTRSNKKTDYDYILRACVDDDYMQEMLAAKLNSATYSDYIRLRAQVQKPDINWFIANYGNCYEIKTIINQIIKIRQIATDEKLNNDEKIDKIQKVVKMKLDMSQINEDISAYEAPDLINFLLRKFNKEKDSEVYVGTIHSVKGLQFPHVFVMGVNDFNFQINYEEDKNLLYVALTRAQDLLTVFYA